MEKHSSQNSNQNEVSLPVVKLYLLREVYYKKDDDIYHIIQHMVDVIKKAKSGQLEEIRGMKSKCISKLLDL